MLWTSEIPLCFYYKYPTDFLLGVDSSPSEGVSPEVIVNEMTIVQDLNFVFLFC